MNASPQAGGSPTEHFYGELRRAFNHFNETLFGGPLPPCFITLRSSNRVYGYHHKDRFVNRQGQTLNELGLNDGNSLSGWWMRSSQHGHM